MAARRARTQASPVTLSAGVVVVRATARGWRVLLLRAWNYWDFPKGVVEAGEDPLGAATREVGEETGIADLEFRWGEDFIETAPYSRNKIARYYVASTATEDVKLPVNPQLGVPEHHESCWFGFTEAGTVVVPRIGAVLAWARERIG